MNDPKDYNVSYSTDDGDGSFEIEANSASDAVEQAGDRGKVIPQMITIWM